MNNIDLPIVPFGKHKGKPITDLLGDKPYLDWLKQQEWFKQHTNIYNIVVHQTIQSNTNSKTPEHNKIQNMFLKDDFQNNILTYIYDLSPNVISEILSILYSHKVYIKWFGKQTIDTTEFNYINSKKSIEFEAIYNWDVILKCKVSSSHIKSIIKGYDSDFDKLDFCSINSTITLSKPDTYSEEYFEINMFIDTILFIEIKPILSDDYPCVLRKMKSQIQLIKSSKNINFSLTKHYILLVDKFSSDVTSIDDIKTIFKQSNIQVILLNELNYTNRKYITITEDEYMEMKKKLKEYETQLKMISN